MIGDAYRVLAILSTHSRIDPSQIALMGFSKGGSVALYASMKRLQRMHAPAGVEFAAYIPFYAPCNTTYIAGDQISDRPIRLFHGTADDWVPVEPCRDYGKRLQENGKDVQLTEYAGARHAFDNPLYPGIRQFPDAQNRTRRCLLEERSSGEVINRETGKPFSFSDLCVVRGATVGYDPKATAEATKAVKEFLTSLWKIPTKQVIQTQQQDRDEQEILQLKREWADAHLRKDAQIFRRLLANEFTMVSSLGAPYNKAEAVAALQDNAFARFDQDNLKVRVYGDSAVVTGRVTYSGRFEGVQYTNKQVLFTDTWVRKDGRWQLVAYHVTLLPTQQR